MDAQQISSFQHTHVTIWNERDRTKRDRLMETIYAEGIKMYDKDFILTGNKAISDFIDQLHQQDSGFLFAASNPMTSTQNGLRLYWQIQSGKQPGLLTGMDFFVTENEKVVHLYVFMDVS